MKKLALAALVVALAVIFVSPASAFFGLFGGKGGGCGATCAPAYCAPVYCAPMYSAPCAPMYCAPAPCKKMYKGKRRAKRNRG